MKYRIVREEGRIYVESKWFLYWSKEREELGWGCDAPKTFGSVEEAEDYVNEVQRPLRREIIKEL